MTARGWLTIAALAVWLLHHCRVLDQQHLRIRKLEKASRP